MPRFDREQLRLELERLARRPIELVLTSNATSYITFMPGRHPLKVRIQRIFLEAPDEVLVAVGRWLGGREKRCPQAVRKFINSPPAGVFRTTHTRRRNFEQRGRCYDVGAILARVNARFFQGRVTSQITWGRRSHVRRVQARTLGAYYRGENVITIHSVLDQWAVPEWFVAFTVYHECLHALQTSDERPHNHAFFEALRRHPDYGNAMRWERANLHLLTRRYEAEPRRAAHRVKRPDGGVENDAGGFLGEGQLKFPW